METIGYEILFHGTYFVPKLFKSEEEARKYANLMVNFSDELDNLYKSSNSEEDEARIKELESYKDVVNAGEDYKIVVCNVVD